MTFGASWHTLLENVEELPSDATLVTPLSRKAFRVTDIQEHRVLIEYRAHIEQNAIALVSNFNKEAIDPRREEWLGHHNPVTDIKQSGLWNINHVEEEYDPGFLQPLERYIDRIPGFD